MRAAPLLAVTVVLSFGCSDSNGPGAPGPVSALKIVSGNTQHATVGAALASPIVVRAVDAQSRPIPGLAVTFTVLTGGGTIAGDSTTTNGQGQASATWTLGTTPDTQRVEAKATSAGVTVRDTLLAVALAGLPTHITMAGDSQAAAPGGAVPDSLVVTLVDRYGNPTPGDTVAWTVTGGGGTVSPTKSVTSATGAAKTQWKLGALGPNTVSASVGTSLAASFFANATTSNPNVFIRIQQRSDTARYIGDALHLSAIVTDQNGAVIPGAVLAWSTRNASIVSVQSAGNLAATVTSKTNGTARVIASFNGSADSVTVLVQQVPVFIKLGDNYPDVVLGQTIQLTATAVDTAGVVVPNSPLVWHVLGSSSNATITAGGSATGVALGLTNFYVTSTANLSSPTGTLIVSRLPATASFSQVVVGDDHACGLDTAGEVWCWGTIENTQYPGPVLISGALTFTQIATQGSLSCGVTGSGSTYCWGNGSGLGIAYAVLEYGTTPVQVSGGVALTSVTVGYNHACGLTSSGAAYCWGFGAFGELGTGNLTSSTTPVAVTGGLQFASLSATGRGACGLLTSGVPYCWGDNGSGQVGNGDQSVDACPNPSLVGMPSWPCSKSPIPVAGSHVFTAIAGGSTHACGLQSDGTAYCWGGNNDGELGDGTSSGPSESSICFDEPFCSLTPVQVNGGLQFSAIAAGNQVTCALDAGGHAYCWGSVANGAPGNGFAVTAPAAVSGGLTFTRIAAGSGACGIVSGGKTYCWGPAPLPFVSNTSVPTLITPP